MLTCCFGSSAKAILCTIKVLPKRSNFRETHKGLEPRGSLSCRDSCYVWKSRVHIHVYPSAPVSRTLVADQFQSLLIQGGCDKPLALNATNRWLRCVFAIRSKAILIGQPEGELCESVVDLRQKDFRRQKNRTLVFGGSRARSPPANSLSLYRNVRSIQSRLEYLAAPQRESKIDSMRDIGTQI